jgi:hypothetical protein
MVLSVAPAAADPNTVSTGLAGQFDPCCHLACDTFANFSPIVLDQMADAARMP